MSEKKYVDLLKANNPNITSMQELIDLGIPNNKVPTGTGLFNSSIDRTQFTYNKTLGSRQFENQGAYIVFGQVPHGGNATGYGGKGVPAESIDLVVGRHASSYGGKGPKTDSVVDNNFATDAARIYISRLCDIDAAFGLDSRPNINNGEGTKSRSGIGIKADAVRIIGREGVKITTGKMNSAKFGPNGETNSLGGKVLPAPKIEFVAGNNYSNVQGIGLGENIRDCLLELTNIIEQIWGSIFNASKTQMEFNSVLGISPLPHVAAGAPWTTLRQGLNVLAPLYHSRVNLLLEVSNNYLTPSSGDYIVSRHVRSN